MKTKLIASIITIFVIILAVSSYQPINAATYTGHDGSVDKYLTKVKVSKLKGTLWAYIVKACATDYSMGIAEVILKSDMG